MTDKLKNNMIGYDWLPYSLSQLARALFLIVVIVLLGCATEGDSTATIPAPSPGVTAAQPDNTPASTAAATATPDITANVVTPTQPTATPKPTNTPTPDNIHTLVSLTDGGQPDQGSKGRVELSSNGRYAVYTSDKFTYLRDLEAGTTTLVSAASNGISADNWSHFGPAISADGSTVAFFSLASNLAEAPYQECPQTDEACGSLYLYGVASGILERIPVAAAVPSSLDTALSADGRMVAFAAPWAFLREGVFLYHRDTGDMTPISLGDIANPDVYDVGGRAVDISADGRYVAFAAPDDGIVSDDTNGVSDVFVYDSQTGQTERITNPLDDIESNQPSGFQDVPNTGGGFESGLSISADGRYVVFMSAASNLVASNLPPCQHWAWADPFPVCRHIYLHDRESGTTELISMSDDDLPGNRASEGGDISADGRWVVFTSLADNLTADNPAECGGYIVTGTCPQVYVRDRVEGRTYLVSRGWDGQAADEYSSEAVITPDGRYVAFVSGAGNLVPGVPVSRHVFATELFGLLESN